MHKDGTKKNIAIGFALGALAPCDRVAQVGSGNKRRDMSVIIRCFCLFACVVMTLDGADAADIYNKEPSIPPPSEAASNWDGFYIGLHGGYGAADWSGIYDNVDQTGGTPISSLDQNGVIYGGQIGYNVLFGNLVTGVEFEIAGANIEDRTTGTDFLGPTHAATAEARTKLLGSLRMRGGFTWNSLLFYGTGGVGFHLTDLTITDPLVVPASDKREFDKVGIAVGAGAEWAAWRNVSLRAQYLFFSFDEDVSLFPGTGDADRGDMAEFNHFHSFTIGANWHF